MDHDRLKEAREERKANRIMLSEQEMTLIKPEIKALAERGNVTLEEYDKLYMNSYERAYLLPHCTNEVLLNKGKYYLSQCLQTQYPSTYNESIVSILFPLVLTRLQQLQTEVERWRKEA